MSMMQIFQDVAEPPTITKPPVNWEKATVPSGTWFRFYGYELFSDKIDLSTGEASGRQLEWKRASFFLPSQVFNIMQLQEDNTWDCIGTLNGPIGYFSLDAYDGDARVLRLQAA